MQRLAASRRAASPCAADPPPPERPPPPTCEQVSRVVCGGCGDFKVVINQPAADHGEWGKKEFAPEAAFMEKLKAIDGTQRHETQEYTFEKL